MDAGKMPASTVNGQRAKRLRSRGPGLCGGARFTPLTYDEIPKLQEVIRALREAGAKVNSSCGLHVHIDAANHNRNSLKNLIGIMYQKEDMLFKALKVNESRASRWCKKVREPVLEKARRLSADETKDLTRLENIW